MKSKLILRAAACVFALAFAAGAVPAAEKLCILPAVTAAAADPVHFDEATGELTISGDFSENEGALRTAQLNRAVTFKALPGTKLPPNCGGLFAGSQNLVSADFSGADFSKVTSLGSLFVSCTNLESVDFGNADISSAETLEYMFSSCSSLKSVSGLKVSSPALTSVSGMFYGCSELESIDLSGFTAKNIKNFAGMFQECCNLASLDLRQFSTASAEKFDYMFCGCSALFRLDLSGFETAQATSMAFMFANCWYLRDLNISSFDTSAVTSMRAMFAGCKALDELDLSGFSTEACTSVREMFAECGQLAKLNLSSFEIGSDTDVQWMFEYSCHLKELVLGSGIQEISSDMRLRQPEFGWENAASPDISVSGDDYYAVIQNDGSNTYRKIADVAEIDGVGMQVTLDGSIGLKFTAHISDQMKDQAAAGNPVFFHFHDQDSPFPDYTTGFAIVEAECDENGAYSAVCRLPAKQMIDEIRVEVWVRPSDDPDDPVMGDQVNYSVKQYANVILSDPEQFASEQNLVRSMLKYGGAAQRHFGYCSRKSQVRADAGVSYEGPAILEADNFVRPDKIAGLTYAGTSILLKSRTVQRHYFKLNSGTIGDYSFTAGGIGKDPVQYPETDFYYIDTDGFSAQTLSKPVEISVVSKSDASQKMTYSYSVMDYVTKGLRLNAADTASAVLIALDQFAQEASDYFA